MTRISKPIFRRHPKEDLTQRQVYVALRDITYHNRLIKAGEVVDAPMFVLQSMFNKRKVGPANHPWTEDIVKTGIYRKSFIKGPVPSMDEVVNEVVVKTAIEGGKEAAGEQPKKKRVRRTKAQILADEAAKAKK